jgi:tRNA threonylcarbamoyladenosine biosynthesis protein TsaE
MKRIITQSEKETFNFAQNFAKNLKGGEIICLTGNLGAGKTTFAKGIAHGLNIKNNITSPTFVFMKVYDLKKDKIKKFVHIDAYRIQSENDIEAIGAPEYFTRKDSVTLIEWADNIKKLLPENSQFIELKNLDQNTREINFK